MRNPASIAVLFLAVSLAPAAQAACEYPADVKIPDGKSATQDDISTASSAVKKYLADMEAYMACIDADAAALPVEQQTPEAKALHVKRYNAAVDAMEATANSFNEQLRAFKGVKKDTP
jgi:DNA repair ATPase RecN